MCIFKLSQISNFGFEIFVCLENTYGLYQKQIFLEVQFQKMNWNKIVDNAYLQVSEEHLPPQQLDLPEYVQDVPEALPETAEEVKKMATMAVRDYQR